MVGRPNFVMLAIQLHIETQHISIIIILITNHVLKSNALDGKGGC